MKTPDYFAVLVVETGKREWNRKGRKEVTMDVFKESEKIMFKGQRAEGKGQSLR